MFGLKKGWMLIWTPANWPARQATRGRVEVIPHPDHARRSDRYAFSAGCCWLRPKHWSTKDHLLQLLLDFHTMVVRDGIAPQAAHRELLKIDEYRRHISPDIEGAEP